jgi:hypothetical protein
MFHGRLVSFSPFLVFCTEKNLATLPASGQGCISASAFFVCAPPTC